MYYTAGCDRRRQSISQKGVREGPARFAETRFAEMNKYDKTHLLPKCYFQDQPVLPKFDFN